MGLGSDPHLIQVAQAEMQRLAMQRTDRSPGDIVGAVLLRLWPAGTRAPSPHGRVYGGSQTDVANPLGWATVCAQHSGLLQFSLEAPR